MVSNVGTNLRARQGCAGAFNGCNAGDRLICHGAQIVATQFSRTSPAWSKGIAWLSKTRRLRLTFSSWFDVTHLKIQCKLVQSTVIMLRTLTFYTNWLQKHNMNVGATRRTHRLTRLKEPVNRTFVVM